MWYLRQEMSFQRHQYHQSTDQPRIAGHASVLSQQLQAPPTAYAEARTSSRIGWNKRDWEEHGP